MSLIPILSSAVVLSLAASAIDAQSRITEQERRRETPSARAYTVTTDRDRPRIGLSTGSSGKRDTLGLLVTEVTRESPAARGGIEEGDRLQSINGVNLRLSAADAGEGDMEGVALRRLTRELAKAKIGDEVELRFYRDGQTRTARVKTVSAEDLVPESTFTFTGRESDDRASLGIGLGLSGSRRDSLGILVASVTDDGPADKARIEEGDRIASINGVDVRVPREDAGDWAAASSRMRRLTRELEKVKPGDAVELRLYRSAQARTVRVTAVARKDLPKPEHGESFFMGGQMPLMLDGLRGLEGLGRIQMFPGSGGRGGAYYFDGPTGGSTRLRVVPQGGVEVEDRLRSAIERLRSVQLRTRVKVELDSSIAPQVAPVLRRRIAVAA